MNKENQAPRRRFTIRSPRRRHRDIRHHNPGTRHRSRTPRVRLLSSIVVVPPKDRAASTSTVVRDNNRSDPVPIPIQGSSPVNPEDLNIPDYFRSPMPSPPEVHWEESDKLEVPPTNSPWRKSRSLIPKPKADYQGEFKIIPGDACQTVPLYIDRDIPWRLRPIDIPVRRTVRHYRSDVNDPRLHDLKIVVTPISMPPNPLDVPTLNDGLFNPPRRPTRPRTTNVLDRLTNMLDQTYGPPKRPSPIPAGTSPAPVERSYTPPGVPPEIPILPSTSSASHEPTISESLAALLRVARLFSNHVPPQEKAAPRKSKHPRRRR